MWSRNYEYVNPQIPTVVFFMSASLTPTSYIFSNDYKARMRENQFPETLHTVFQQGDGDVTVQSQLLHPLK